MTKLLSDRIRLIRGLQTAQSNGFTMAEKAVIAKIITTIRKDPDQQFLSYSQEELCKISYASSPLHRIDSARRTRTTLPRYIRRQLGIAPDQLKDHLLDALVGYAFATLDPAKADNPPFEFLSGRSIVTAYKNGPGSCMAGWCSQYVDFYALNPKRVQLMVLDKPVTFFANGTETTLPMKARALLWTADDGRRMLDRVYVGIGGARHNEGDCSATLSNGKNGQCVCRDVIRAYRHWATKHDVINRGSLVNRFEVTMKLGRHVPYMDTLCWGAYLDDALLLISNREAEHCLQRTDGCRPGEEDDDEGYSCHTCDCHIAGDDVYWAFDDPYCDHCFHVHFFHCDTCSESESDDYRVDVGDLSYCRSCTTRLLKQCVDCDEHDLAGKMNVVHAPGGDVHVCKQCIDEYTCCAGCLEFNARTFMHDGQEYCLKCHEKLHMHEPEAA